MVVRSAPLRSRSLSKLAPSAYQTGDYFKRIQDAVDPLDLRVADAVSELGELVSGLAELRGGAAVAVVLGAEVAEAARVRRSVHLSRN